MKDGKQIETLELQLTSINAEIRRLLKITEGLGELKERRKVIYQKLTRIKSGQTEMFKNGDLDVKS